MSEKKSLGEEKLPFMEPENDGSFKAALLFSYLNDICFKVIFMAYRVGAPYCSDWRTT